MKRAALLVSVAVLLGCVHASVAGPVDTDNSLDTAWLSLELPGGVAIAWEQPTRASAWQECRIYRGSSEVPVGLPLLLRIASDLSEPLSLARSLPAEVRANVRIIAVSADRSLPAVEFDAELGAIALSVAGDWSALRDYADLTGTWLDSATEALPHLWDVHFSNVECLDGALNSLHKLRSLRTLRLSGVTGSAAPYTRSEPLTLDVAEIEQCDATDLKFLHGSRDVSIVSSPAADDHVGALFSPRLRALSVARCKRVTGQFIAELGECGSLQEIAIRDISLESRHLATLNANRSPKLVSLARDSELGDDDLVHLRDVEGVYHLDLSRCDGITDRGLRVLRTMPDLVILDLSHCSLLTEDCIDVLAGFHRLEQLHLNGVAFSPEAGASLRRRLPNCDVRY